MTDNGRPIRATPSAARWSKPASATSAQDPTRHAPTARPSASSDLVARVGQPSPYQTSAERAQATPAWLCDYNSRRPHSALGRQPPISRLKDNVLGNDS